MPDFHVRADSVDVEQIMRQIRGRIREKRGVDYTEEQIQELARVKLERFLDPRGVRSDLLDQFRRTPPPESPPTYEFDDRTLFASDKPLVRLFRRLLRPLLKLLLNPNTLNRVLHMQADVNRFMVTSTEQRAARDVLFYEVMHNLVVEMTRTSIEVKNMKMRVESLAGRLDFAERRARALEGIVQYRPDALADAGQVTSGQGGRDVASPVDPGTVAESGAIDPVTGGESLRTRRRRRRRGRRSGPGFGGTGTEGESAVPETDAAGSDEGPSPPDETRGGEPRTAGPGTAETDAAAPAARAAGSAGPGLGGPTHEAGVDVPRGYAEGADPAGSRTDDRDPDPAPGDRSPDQT